MEPPTATTSSQCWLDLLPDGVCEKIASCVAQGVANSAALHLAEISGTQAQAIAHALDFSLESCVRGVGVPQDDKPEVVGAALTTSTCDIKRHEKAYYERWMNVMAPYVQVVTHWIPQLFDAQHVRKIMLFDEDCGNTSHLESLKWLVNHKRLQKVSHLSMYVDQTVDSKVMFDVLSKLPLTHLTLSGYVPTSCSSRNSSGEEMPLKRRRVTLPDCCTSLQSLTLRGRSISKELLSALPAFSSLEELVLEEITEKVPGQVCEWMQTLKRVDLNMVSSFSTAQSVGRIGRSVRSFSTTTVLFPHDIYELSKCSLQSLNIVAEAEVDTALLDNVESFADLRELSVKFYAPRQRFPRKKTFYEIKNNTLLRLLRRLPLLKELKMLKVKISWDELVLALECLKDRLEVFETTLYGQEESEQERYLGLLQVFLGDFPCLRKCQLFSSSFFRWETRESDREGTKTITVLSVDRVSRDQKNKALAKWVERRMNLSLVVDRPY